MRKLFLHAIVSYLICTFCQLGLGDDEPLRFDRNSALGSGRIPSIKTNPKISHTISNKRQGDKITAFVNDDVDILEVKFHIQDSAMTSPIVIPMTDPSLTGSYSCNIPESVIIGVAHYMLSAKAADGKIAYDPEGARPEGNIISWHAITIMDGLPPEIEHTAIDFLKQGGQISATISDNTKVKSVYLYFEDAEGNRSNQLEMELQLGSNLFVANIPSDATLGQGYYFIEATDISNNKSSYPSSGSSTNKYTWQQLIITDGTPPEIAHNQVAETQAGLPISVDITDNVEIAEVVLYFQNIAGEITLLPMSLAEGNYSTQLPSDAPIGDSRYLIEARDTNDNVAYNPTDATAEVTESWHSIKILPDTTKPVIEHDKLSSTEISGKMTAIVTDNVEVKSVVIFMGNNPNGPFESSPMQLVLGDRYEGNAPVVDRGTAYYFIEATDTSENIARLPAGTYTITTTDTTPPIIEHASVEVSVENQPIEIRVMVTDNYGVDSVVLHYWSEDVEAVSGDMSLEANSEFVDVIPAQTQSIFYAIVATDVVGNEKSFPLTAKPGTSGQKINIQADSQPPTISHTPLASYEAGTPLSIVATVTDDVKVASVSIDYTAPDGTETAETAMTKLSQDQYQWESPAIHSIGAVKYTIKAVDLAENETIAPEPYQTIIVDTKDPSIEVVRIANSPDVVEAQAEAGQPIVVEATITDNTQIAAVKLFYKSIGSVNFKSIEMLAPLVLDRQTLLVLDRQIQNSLFHGTIPAQNAVGSVDYYIEAGDIADPPNVKQSENYTIEITDTSPPVISHTLPGELQPGQPLSAEISDAVEVISVSLHYQAPDGTLSTIEMSPVEQTVSLFKANIPADTAIGTAEYWFEAIDSEANIGTAPAGDERYELEILPDRTPPTIEHFPVTTATAGLEVEIKATVQDNVGIETVYLLYKPVASLSPISIEMLHVEQTVSLFKANIPAQKATGVVEYYLIAKDSEGNSQRHPEQEDVVHEMTLTDKVPPMIQHELIANALVGEEILIDATISDNIAVGDVTLFYRPVGGQDDIEVLLVEQTDSLFYGTIPAQNEIGVVYYYIVAKDTNADPNTAYMPPSAEFGASQRMDVIIDDAPPEITHTPVITADAGTMIEAEVTDNFGVKSVKFVYMVDGHEQSLDMLPVEQTDGIRPLLSLFNVPIPIDMPIGMIRYQIEAVDENDNVARFPETGEELQLEIIEDRTPPEIEHTPVRWEKAGRSISISAKVEDFVGVTSVTLFYKEVSATDYVQKEMVVEPLVLAVLFTSRSVRQIQNSLFYSAEIPAQMTAGTVSYYIRARDKINETYFPQDQASAPYEIKIEPDSQPPSVKTEMIAAAQPGDLIEATVTDDVGVASVWFLYSTSTTDFIEVPMVESDDGLFQTAIPSDVAVGNIFYQIKAIDVNGNESPKSLRSLEIQTDTQPPICEHTPPEKAEAGADLTITVSVDDNVGVEKVKLYYYDPLVEDYNFIEMVLVQGSEYSANIPKENVIDSLRYYIEAIDVNGLQTKSPPSAPDNNYEVVVEDTVGPSITHTADENIKENTPIKLSAVVEDPAGLADVFVEFWNVDDEKETKTMIKKIGDQYEAIFQAQKKTGNIKYRIVATDGNGVQNSSAFYTLAIIDGTPPQITRTLPADDFSQVLQNEPIKIEAEVSDQSEIASVTVHYKMSPQEVFTQISMELSETMLYSANIPASSNVGTLSYWISAQDNLDNLTIAPDEFYEIAILDNMPPVIESEIISSGQVGTKQTFSAKVTDDSGIKSVVLHYQDPSTRLQSGDESFEDYPMEQQSPDNYSVQVTFSSITGQAYYYISAADSIDKTTLVPETVNPEQPETAYTISLKDTQAPEIFHTPIANEVDENDEIELIADKVTDNGQISNVELYYKNVGAGTAEPFESIEMELTETASQYKINIPKQSALGIFRYFIFADDQNGNESYLNQSGSVSNIEDARVEPFQLTIVDATAPVITHIPIETASQNKPIEVTATVIDRTSETLVLPHENVVVSLFYKMPTQSVFTKIDMASTGTPDEYGGTIPESSETGELYYRIEAEDENGNKSVKPSDLANPYVINVVDDVPPVVEHTNITTREVGEMIDFVANVSDDIGIESVTLFFKGVAEDSFEEIAMEAQTNILFYSTIPAGTDAGTAYYYIKATDKIGNVVFFVSEPTNEEPTEGYKVRVEDTLPPEIVHTPPPNEVDENDEIEIIADKVTDNGKISSVKLYYKNVDAGTSELFESIEMELTETTSQYTVNISKQEELGIFRYFLCAVDQSGNEVYLNQSGNVTSIEDARVEPFQLTIVDATAPTITHTPIETASQNKLIEITATVTDRSENLVVSLSYKIPTGETGTATTFTKIDMLSTGTPDEYGGIIPGSPETGKLYYRIEAEDENGNNAVEPSDLSNPHIINVIDDVPPIIEHTNITTKQVGEMIDFVANVSDDSGVESVTLFFKGVAEESFEEIAMELQPPSEFKAELDAETSAGTAYYYIKATDEIGNVVFFVSEPTSEEPTTGYRINVKDTPPSIEHTNVTIGQVGEMIDFVANVTDDSGVESVTLFFKEVGKDSFVSTPMELQPPSEFSVELEAGTITGDAYYYIRAEDKGGNVVFFVSEPTSDEPAEGYKINVKDTQPPEISYTQAFNQVDANTELELIVKVTDNGQISSVKLYYKDVGVEQTEQFKSIEMQFTGTASQYRAQIPRQTQLGDVSYFIGAFDEKENSAYLSLDGQTEKYEDAIWSPYQITLIDTAPPTISHTRPEVWKIESGEPIVITAEIYDSIGVSEAKVYYRPVEVSRTFRQIDMEPEDENDPENNLWTGFARFKAQIDTWGISGKVEYYIEATDVAEPEPHTSILPEEAADEKNPTYLEIEVSTPDKFDFRIGNNRFNPDVDESCIIMYDLPEGGELKIKIFSLAGEEVDEITTSWGSAGSHQYNWDGTNKNYETVASGIYFVVFEFDGERHVKRVAVIR